MHCSDRGRATHQSRLEFLPKASRYRSTAACDGVCSRGACGGLLQEHLTAAGGRLCHCYRSTAPALPPARSLVASATGGPESACYRSTLLPPAAACGIATGGPVPL